MGLLSPTEGCDFEIYLLSGGGLGADPGRGASFVVGS